MAPLDHRDKFVVGGALATVVAMGLFPPWRIVFASGVAHDYGYAFLGSPPSGAEINFAILVVQWVIVVSLVIGWFVFHQK